jgi:hypothetical protein
MNKDIRVITDQNLLHEIYTTLFSKRPVFLRANNQNIQVQFLKYENHRVFLRISDQVYALQRSIIYIRHNEELIFSHINPVGQQNDVFVFTAEHVQVMKSERKEERKAVDAKKDESFIVTNIITDSVIKDSVSSQSKKISFLKDEIMEKIPGSYDNVKVFFSGERSIDVRMKNFIRNRKPVFINDIGDASLFENNKDNQFYLNSIYSKDPMMENEKLQSEISVPLLYKAMMPFGYIQVNSKSILTKEEFSSMRKVGTSVSELLSQSEELFIPLKEKLLVADLSESGLGIEFSDRSIIRHFKEETYLLFSLFLPGGNQATILSLLKNFNVLEGQRYRMGCEIENIDPIGEVAFTEFIEKMEKE